MFLQTCLQIKYLLQLYQALHPKDTETTEGPLIHIAINYVQLRIYQYICILMTIYWTVVFIQIPLRSTVRNTKEYHYELI